MDSYAIAQLIIGVLGSLTTILCFLPQGIKTFITKDTSGLSKWFFISALISSFFWFAIGAMTIAAPVYYENGDLPSAIAAGIPSILTNVITVIINFIILVIKLTNMHHAKKEGISEHEYCNRFKIDKLSKL